MRRIRREIAVVAPHDVSVLILGESGTGKELVARAIHAGSPRRTGPFEALNSANLPQELIESELFGHEKGAFTGANERRLGLFELANGGTAFLDEFANMSLGAQAKCLRALEYREFRRVGGNGVIRADVRFLAATNADLVRALEAGALRADLFNRFEETIEVPPLRELKEDIPALVEHGFRQLAAAAHEPAPVIAAEAMALFASRPYAVGNVRELLGLVGRTRRRMRDPSVVTRDDVLAALAASGPHEAIRLASASGRANGPPPDRRASAPFAWPEGATDGEKRAAILRALEAARWNKSTAAKHLGICRDWLRREMARLGIPSEPPTR